MARIAFVILDLGGGGAERVTVTLVNELASRKHEVDLVVMQRKGELLELVHPDVRIIDLQAPRVRNLLGPLMRYLRDRRPDAVLASMWPVTVAAVIAHRLSGSKARLIVSDHAILSDHYPAKVHPVLKLTMKFFYPLANGRIAVSNGAARDLATLSGLPASHFTVIHNPVDFPPSVERSPVVDALWGGASKRILTVGHLKPEKDQAFLIRAFSLLSAEMDARLMILGTGQLRDELKREAAACGVADRVIFAGYASDPWPFYASADLFVLGSREESFGNVLVEALYAGLPIVSTDNVGAREVLDNGRWGRIVAQDDVAAFAKAMEEMLREPRRNGAERERALALSGAESVNRYESLLLGGGAHDTHSPR